MKELARDFEHQGQNNKDKKQTNRTPFRAAENVGLETQCLSIRKKQNEHRKERKYHRTESKYDKIEQWLFPNAECEQV